MNITYLGMIIKLYHFIHVLSAFILKCSFLTASCLLVLVLTSGVSCNMYALMHEMHACLFIHSCIWVWLTFYIWICWDHDVQEG